MTLPMIGRCPSGVSAGGGGTTGDGTADRGMIGPFGIDERGLLSRDDRGTPSRDDRGPDDRGPDASRPIASARPVAGQMRWS
jgi:hypothetical protein